MIIFESNKQMNQGTKHRKLKARNKEPKTNKPQTKNQNRETLNLFDFQVRESPAPLNIPTPTPVPDRGGPVVLKRLKFLIPF